MSWGLGFEVSKAHSRTPLSFSFLPADQDVRYQVVLYCPACLPAALMAAVTFESPSETVSQLPMEWFPIHCLGHCVSSQQKIGS